MAGFFLQRILNDIKDSEYTMSCRHLTKLNSAAPRRGKLEGEKCQERLRKMLCSNRQVCHELWLKDGKFTAN